MKEKIKKLVNTKQFHMVMVILIIAVILAVVGLISLRYNEQGETNLPFKLTKITVISSVEGIDNEDTENKWNLTVNQNNDIYLYIEKNENYTKEEAIEKITISNFVVEQRSEIGEKQLYKADKNSEKTLFKNIEENKVDYIEYKGKLESNIKSQKISNQGGLVVFRYAIDNIGNYISNEDEEINHDELLKKLEISNDELKTNIKFDIVITLNSGKIYNSNVKLELPIGNVVEKGTQSQEITDLSNIIFKRLEIK